MDIPFKESSENSIVAPDGSEKDSALAAASESAFDKFSSRLIPVNCMQHARNSAQHATKRIDLLLEQRRLPAEPFSEPLIRELFNRFALLDANNYDHGCGLGEREGRVFSSIVARRHFFLSHGVGRSGDVAAVQPKAAGSSLLARLANDLACDTLRVAGTESIRCAAIIPMATGMTLSLCVQTLRERRRCGSTTPKYVLWSRIDQKSCAKCISAAGLIPIVVALKMDSATFDLSTDLDALRAEIDRIGDSSQIACIMSTTSAFAPRSPDKVIEIARLCREKEIPHLINNAYGTQSKRCMNLINEASRQGRVDVIVQSLDKNYMIPVGGALVAVYEQEILDSVTKMYPGRASATPAIDFLITMLHMGRSGYERLLHERQENFEYLKKLLVEFAAQHNERVVHSPNNIISLAMSLTTCIVEPEKNATKLGAMLFARGVSGVRVCVPDSEKKTIIAPDVELRSFGTHYDSYPFAYMTVAAAIGVTKKEIDLFFKRLSSVVKSLNKKPAPVQ